jgi:hypothetical protein
MSRRLVLLGLVIAAVLAVGVTQAKAVVVGAPPPQPISDMVAGPPPIPQLPAAGAAAPPAEEIADPVSPGVSCGGWHLQSKYGVPGLVPRLPLGVPGVGRLLLLGRLECRLLRAGRLHVVRLRRLVVLHAAVLVGRADRPLVRRRAVLARRVDGRDRIG